MSTAPAATFIEFPPTLTRLPLPARIRHVRLVIGALRIGQTHAKRELSFSRRCDLAAAKHEARLLTGIDPNKTGALEAQIAALKTLLDDMLTLQAAIIDGSADSPVID
jgi:hypothetical protein